MKYGLDFGTSNSAISFNDGRKISILPLEKNSGIPETIPSLWYFDASEEKWYFGNDASIEYKQNSGDGRFIQSVKKVLADKKYVGTNIGRRFYTVEKLVELYFREIKNRADDIVGKHIDRISIGKPVRFSDDLNEDIGEQRLHIAAKNAGFEEINFVLEPLAATYTLEKQITRPTNVFTIDIGGGTTDISIVYLTPKGKGSSSVLATNGVSIGGIDFTSRIMKNRLLHHFGLDTTYKNIFGKKMIFPKYALKNITNWYNSIKIQHNQQFISFLKEVKKSTSDPDKIKSLEELIFERLGFEVFEAIESAKITLSKNKNAAIECLQRDTTIQEKIKRFEFEHYIDVHVQKITQMIDDTLGRTQLKSDQIDFILMIGGASEIPFLKKVIKDKFAAASIIKTNIYSRVAYGLGFDN